jgi:hypothetical protein
MPVPVEQRCSGHGGADSSRRNLGWELSVDTAGRHNPLAGLARHLGDQLKIVFVVKQRESGGLGSSSDKQIWDLSSPLASGCEKALDLSGASRVIGGGLDKLEDRHIGHVLVPFASMATSVADL